MWGQCSLDIKNSPYLRLALPAEHESCGSLRSCAVASIMCGSLINVRELRPYVVCGIVSRVLAFDHVRYIRSCAVAAFICTCGCSFEVRSIRLTACPPPHRFTGSLDCEFGRPRGVCMAVRCGHHSSTSGRHSLGCNSSTSGQHKSGCSGRSRNECSSNSTSASEKCCAQFQLRRTKFTFFLCDNILACMRVGK